MSAKFKAFLKQLDKLATVFIILEQVSAVNAAGHHMMKRSGNYYPCFARHALIYYYTPVPDYYYTPVPDYKDHKAGNKEPPPSLASDESIDISNKL
jgi:hypothetical protein